MCLDHYSHAAFHSSCQYIRHRNLRARVQVDFGLLQIDPLFGRGRMKSYDNRQRLRDAESNVCDADEILSAPTNGSPEPAHLKLNLCVADRSCDHLP